MDLENYLDQKTSEGELLGDGSFTLDLARAAEKLTAFALPSDYHYLLKLIQVAQQLDAEQVDIKLEKFRTVLRFHCSEGGPLMNTEIVYRAFCAPLEVKDPILSDFVSGLLGTMNKQITETLWSYSSGHTGQRVFIDRERRFSIENFTLSKPRDPSLPPISFTLSVLHKKSWKFWQGARRRATTLRTLEENCRFCGIQVLVDNRETSAASVIDLNSHLTIHRVEQGYLSSFHLAAHNIAFRLAPDDRHRFEIIRSSQSSYVVRENHLNVWASGTRASNQLEPDGVSSAAWMLQFQSDTGPVSMRNIPKSVPCGAVLVVNHHTRGADTPLRLLVVRNGLLVLDKQYTESDSTYEALKGCVLVMTGHELETDLTGLQVIENENFEKAVLSHLQLLRQALDYSKRAGSLLTM